jgi:hypothetical protein
MKNPILKFSLLLVLFLNLSSYGQKADNNEILNTSRSVTQFDTRAKDLVGSSYIDENFSLAKLSNSDILYSLRYDAFQEEMELTKDGKLYYLPKTFNYTITFEDTNKTYKLYTFEQKGENINGFFVVLLNGNKFSLLLKENIKFTEEVMPNTGYEKYKPPTLKRTSDKLYIGYMSNIANELPSKKKDLLELFSSKQNDVEKYAKDHKLSFNNNNDLVELFKYYNTLN